MTESLQVRRLASALGAEVRGLSLARAGEAEAAIVSDLIHEHMVLFFPDQHLSVDEHVAFGRHFGPLEPHPNVRNAYLEHPYIFELAATKGGIADEWHSDITFQAEPSVFAILNMLRCPEVGGDTMWANAAAAYENLSAPLREMCDGLSALHDADPHNRSDQTCIHPVVRVHPVTGRRSLFVNEHFTRRIVELSHEESAMLLGYLTRWISSPRFTVRYRWQPGTIAMWDNRCTQHFVLNDFEGERIIQRVTVMGDKPEAAVPSRWPPFRRAVGAGATSRLDRQLNRHLKAERPALDDLARAQGETA
ncbi:MAG: TauD/TfdA family dioxygenase [Burkholderiaceae bacterium]